MKKLDEYKDEEALELLAELVSSVVRVLGDKEIGEIVKSGNKINIIAAVIKKYPKDIMEIMAILEGVPVEEYHINIVSLPKMLLDIVNDPLLSDFFVSQGEMVSQIPSGSAMEHTQENEK